MKRKHGGRERIERSERDKERVCATRVRERRRCRERKLKKEYIGRERVKKYRKYKKQSEKEQAGGKTELGRNRE